MAYLVPETEWSGQKHVQVLSKISVLEDIRQKLSNAQKEEFQKSVFGHLLDVKVMNIIPQLLHHLVIRQIRSEKEDELAFNIVGTHYTFSLKEYAATMGLKTKRVVEIKKKNLKKGSLDKYLENILAKINKEEKDPEKHAKSVRKKHVKIAFDSYHGKNDETMLKLAKLHIIENFLLGNQGKIMIKDEHVDILDVHWMFKDYHWGRISFKETIDSFRSATTKQGLNSYPLYGCPIALQIWASEIIAAVNIYVKRIGHLIPRIRNWASNEQPTWKTLQQNVFEEFDNEYYEFIITNDEFIESYMEEFRTPEFIEEEKNKQQKTAQIKPKDSASTTTISTRLLEQIIQENRETKQEVYLLKKLVLEIHNKIFGQEQVPVPATEQAGPSTTLVEEEEVENREEAEKEEQRKEKESTQTIDDSGAMQKNAEAAATVSDITEEKQKQEPKVKN
ncbi:hypothetical protein TorRG33x02_130570 [Trema orientale]|uniref:DUF1985 domain-containing protein n=1 Tax=Trema orientale TaxID=63057 RepID=A0A2P5F0E5_TREOI|nr:hypothetical protein TorRG33x02_130570 [Trema orientale]